jgi:tetratricopeptide (TPR) repeat protein
MSSSKFSSDPDGDAINNAIKKSDSEVRRVFNRIQLEADQPLAMGLLREFAEADPIVPADDRNPAACFHCGGTESPFVRRSPLGPPRVKHGNRCPWKRARKFLGITIATIALLVLAVATPARAQTTDPVTEQIRHGIALRETGDDAAALLEFQHAFDVSHRALALAQMGLAEQALGHWADAESHVRAALAAQGDAWIDRHREALQAAYAVIREHAAPPVEPVRPVTVPAEPARIPVNRAAPPIHTASTARSNTLPIGLAAGAAVLLGVGVTGLLLRESTAQAYNRTCRGLGDPAPSSACLESAWVGSANGATALAATGFITGGLLAVVTAIVFARPAGERPRAQALAWCGAGPGDLGIACGGSL